MKEYIAEGKCIAKQNAESSLSASKYIAEAELHGRHVYWHGSKDGSPKIDIENAQHFGMFPCFFFTTHFGYALNYVYPAKSEVNLDDSKKTAAIYKPFSKPSNEIPMKEDLIAYTDSTGWLFQLKMIDGVNIFIGDVQADIHKLYEILTPSKWGPLYREYNNVVNLCARLAREDWFFLNKEYPKYGFSREEFLNFMKDSNYAGFAGFHNFETQGKMSSIGLFKNKINVMQINKTYKVRYENGKILISEHLCI